MHFGCICNDFACLWNSCIRIRFLCRSLEKYLSSSWKSCWFICFFVCLLFVCIFLRGAFSYLCWRCLSSLALFSVACFLLGVMLMHFGCICNDFACLWNSCIRIKSLCLRLFIPSVLIVVRLKLLLTKTDLSNIARSCHVLKYIIDHGHCPTYHLFVGFLGLYSLV